LVSGRTAASLVTAGFRGQHVTEDMLLRKTEVQYVLPKCRSTIARLICSGRRRLSGPLGPPCFDAHPTRNDLKFRTGRSFCNIETKIRQYA
jgi:hypothetical protein